MKKTINLVKQINNLGIRLLKSKLPDNLNGFYYEDNRDKLIALNTSLRTQAEQNCVLAEELGHYYTSYGNLLTDNCIDITSIRRQELRAKRWAVKKLVPILDLIRAYKAGCRSADEAAEFLEITEDFLKKSLQEYTNMYGISKRYGKFLIYFDPLKIEKG